MSSSVAALQKRFISSPTFSVLGASSDRAKYGNKVLRWYQSRGLPVTPINPVSLEFEYVPTTVKQKHEQKRTLEENMEV
jgi:predicted CoA-binding protein